jgi:hypothetical protein
MTSDLTDQATDREEELRQEALQLRKPVPDRCECGKPVAILHNGAHCKYCNEHLVIALAGDLDAA